MGPRMLLMDFWGSSFLNAAMMIQIEDGVSLAKVKSRHFEVWMKVRAFDNAKQLQRMAKVWCLFLHKRVDRLLSKSSSKSSRSLLLWLVAEISWLLLQVRPLPLHHYRPFLPVYWQPLQQPVPLSNSVLLMVQFWIAKYPWRQKSGE